VYHSVVILHRVLLSAYTALLSVYTALLGVYTAHLTIVRTLKKLLGFSAVSCKDFRKQFYLWSVALQCVAMYCSVLQFVSKSFENSFPGLFHWYDMNHLYVNNTLIWHLESCSVLQFVAACCSVLQCVAVCCTDI